MSRSMNAARREAVGFIGQYVSVEYAIEVLFELLPMADLARDYPADGADIGVQVEHAAANLRHLAALAVDTTAVELEVAVGLDASSYHADEGADGSRRDLRDFLTGLAAMSDSVWPQAVSRDDIVWLEFQQ